MKMTEVWKNLVKCRRLSNTKNCNDVKDIHSDVWRWIRKCSHQMKKNKLEPFSTNISKERVKRWQGSAFVEIDKVVHIPVVIPTPCLVVKHMHEGIEATNEGHVKQIENAILEKCKRGGADIHHIFVDEDSKQGCVYVKFNSLESCGKAFRCLYGSWYDSRLITVQFMNSSKYQDLFPSSKHSTDLLNPDPEVPSSLSLCNIKEYLD